MLNDAPITPSHAGGEMPQSMPVQQELVQAILAALVAPVAWEIPDQMYGPELTTNRSWATSARSMGLTVRELVYADTLMQLVVPVPSSSTPSPKCGDDTDLEDKITEWFEGQIADGALHLADMPRRLARLGLMSPNDFIDEMNERMGEPEICLVTVSQQRLARAGQSAALPRGLDKMSTAKRLYRYAYHVARRKCRAAAEGSVEFSAEHNQWFVSCLLQDEILKACAWHYHLPATQSSAAHAATCAAAQVLGLERHFADNPAPSLLQRLELSDEIYPYR